MSWYGSDASMQDFEDRHGLTFPSLRDDDGSLFAHFGVVSRRRGCSCRRTAPRTWCSAPCPRTSWRSGWRPWRRGDASRLAESSSMGFRDIGKRLKASVEELDNARLQGRFVGKELTPIEELPLRTPIRVGGEVTRMRITPRSGTPALEVVVCDGTGDLVVDVHRSAHRRRHGERARRALRGRRPPGAGPAGPAQPGLHAAARVGHLVRWGLRPR